MNRNSIPASVTACITPSPLVNKLNKYADNLEKIAKWMVLFFFLAGVVSMFLDPVAQLALDDENILLLLLYLLPWPIYGLVACAVCNVLAMVVRSLATLVYNTSVSANIAVLEAVRNRTPEPKPAPKAEAPKEEAPKEEAPKAAEPVRQEPTVTENGWICPQCGQKNMNIRTTCWRCDYQKQ